MAESKYGTRRSDNHKKTEINLAENGNCGVFAVALLQGLVNSGITTAEMVVIADSATADSMSPSFEDFYDIDIFHIAVFVDGQYYDINGKTSGNKMLKDFVPYGGPGITPADYTPMFGRDFVSESFTCASPRTVSAFRGFVEAATNAQTSVENYVDIASTIAGAIRSNEVPSGINENTLREYVRHLLESECPTSNNGWTQYYDVDPNNPPSIQAIMNCWIENGGKIYDRSMPLYYSPKDVVQYREYKRGRLRSDVTGDYYRKLKNSIAREGIKENIHIIIGLNGVAKIGEGNHRHEIALEVGLDKMPVFIHFNQEVRLTPHPSDVPMTSSVRKPLEDIR